MARRFHFLTPCGRRKASIIETKTESSDSRAEAVEDRVVTEEDSEAIIEADTEETAMAREVDTAEIVTTIEEDSEEIVETVTVREADSEVIATPTEEDTVEIVETVMVKEVDTVAIATATAREEAMASTRRTMTEEDIALEEAEVEVVEETGTEKTETLK